MYTTERIRELSRKARALNVAAEQSGSGYDYAEADGATEDVYEYTLEAIASGNLNDDRYAAELALGQHDDDGGLE